MSHVVHPVGVDVGNGHVKIAGPAGTVGFPALLAKAPAERPTGMTALDLERITVTFGGQRFWIGQQAQRARLPQTPFQRDRVQSLPFRMLFFAGLGLYAWRAGLDDIAVAVVTGLPVLSYSTEDMFQEFRDAVEVVRFWDGTKALATITVRVVALQDIPQPMGTVLDGYLDERGQVRQPEWARGRHGVVDIGFGTVDLAAVDPGLRYNPDLSAGYTHGMYALYDLVRRRVFAEYHVELALAELHAVMADRTLVLAGQTHDVSGIIEEAAEQAAAQIWSDVNLAWPNLESFLSLTLAGGGVHVLGDRLQAAFPAFTRVAPDPQWANARGFAKAAQGLVGEADATAPAASDVVG